MDPNAKELYGCSFNPFATLTFYSQAKVGPRIAISNEMFYYKEHLQQAIEGRRLPAPGSTSSRPRQGKRPGAENRCPGAALPARGLRAGSGSNRDPRT